MRPSGRECAALVLALSLCLGLSAGAPAAGSVQAQTPPPGQGGAPTTSPPPGPAGARPPRRSAPAKTPSALVDGVSECGSPVTTPVAINQIFECDYLTSQTIPATAGVDFTLTMASPAGMQVVGYVDPPVGALAGCVPAFSGNVFTLSNCAAPVASPVLITLAVTAGNTAGQLLFAVSYTGQPPQPAVAPLYQFDVSSPPSPVFVVTNSTVIAPLGSAACSNSTAGKGAASPIVVGDSFDCLVTFAAVSTVQDALITGTGSGTFVLTGQNTDSAGDLLYLCGLPSTDSPCTTFHVTGTATGFGTLGFTDLSFIVGAPGTPGTAAVAPITGPGGGPAQIFAPSATAVTPSPSTLTFGQAATFAATVSCTGFTPTGLLILLDNGAAIGSHTLLPGDNGAFTFVVSGLAAGSHSIQATYAGDGNCGPSNSTPFTLTVGSASVGASQSAIGCANSTLASDIAFPTTPNGTLSGSNQLLIGAPVSPGTTPASLAFNTPLAVVECGAVFEDVGVSGSAVADLDPSTLPGGSITYTLSTAVANTTTLTGQPIALILESNSTGATLSCGSVSAPAGTGPAGLESCQGAVLLRAGGPPAIPGPGCFAALTCSYAVPSPGNLVHVGLRAGASFPLVGGGSPVLTLSATYTRFSSLGSLPGISAATSLTTGATAIGLSTPVYSATLTAAPATIPAASGSGQGSTLTAALYHTAATSCSGIAGFVVTVPGGFVVCPTAAAVAGGAAGAILQTAAGAESGVVSFTTTSGVLGSTSATPGTSGQQVFSTHCGQLPNTAPLVLLPTLGQPFSTSTPFTSACLSATAVLYGGGSAGTAVVAASYVGDVTGGTAVATTTVQLSPSANTTNLTRGCNEVITAASTVAGATVASVIGTVQPGGIVLSAWQFSNGLHAFQAGYFVAAGAPVDSSTLGPNQSLFVCVSGSGTFPTGAF